MKNVTVHVPGTLNLDQCHKVLASVLGKCGHPTCLSGFNIAFENAVDPADKLAALIDQLLAADWEARGVKPAAPADDAEFCRRVYLDVIGRAPKVAETREFLDDLSAAYYKQFHAQIQVNSAVRTVKVQKKLRRHNRNAAPAEGEIASSHLAGVTVDIQRRGLSREQIGWVQNYMVPLKAQGLIEPEEERHQWVFHVMVSGRYTDWRESKMLNVEPYHVRASTAMSADGGAPRKTSKS